MEIISFNSQALSGASINPPNLSWSPYAPQGDTITVTLLETGVGPEGDPAEGKQVLGIAFNKLATDDITESTVTLAIDGGTTFDVDTGHEGATFAVIYADRSSALFTVDTSIVSPDTQTITYNGFNTSYPEQRRIWTLGY